MTTVRRLSSLGALAALVTASACSDGSPTATSGDDWELPPPSAAEMATTITQCNTLDFEGFAHGDQVTTLASGFGFDVSVDVELSAAQDVQSLPEARIFDTNWAPLTNDPDLQDDYDCPGCGAHGNVIMIQQEPGFLPAPQGDMVPDDSRTGGRIVFSGFTGHGDFSLQSFVAIDDDVGEPDFLARVDGSLLLEPQSSALGNGTVETVVITTEHTFQDQFSIEYFSSGATDDLVICQDQVVGGEGCTPGYWKNEPQDGNWSGTGYHQDDTFGSVFGDCAGIDLQRPESGALCDVTLIDALGLRGGGVNALARHAVAALLNASSPDVLYPYTTGGVITAVNGALSGGSYEATKNMFAEANESFCPLSRTR